MRPKPRRTHKQSPVDPHRDGHCSATLHYWQPLTISAVNPSQLTMSCAHPTLAINIRLIAITSPLPYREGRPGWMRSPVCHRNAIDTFRVSEQSSGVSSTIPLTTSPRSQFRIWNYPPKDTICSDQGDETLESQGITKSPMKGTQKVTRQEWRSRL